MGTSDRAGRAAWRARVRGWIEGPLDSPALNEGFARELDETNLRRLRVLLPIMVVLHAGHMLAFHTSEAERAALDPTLVQWRAGVVLVHGVTLVFALACALAAPFATRARPLGRVFGPLVALGYLMHAAAITGLDQLSAAGATVYVGYALGVAVIVAMRPVVAALLYGAGLAAFIASIQAMQPVAHLRLMVLPNGVSSSIVAAALATMLFAVRRRDYAQRVLIDQQRAELAAVNAGLEQRVKEQVSETLARARQIDQLNAQLRAQVRARSTELSIALANLARMRTAEGDLRKGVILGHRFEIDALLGRGGMGAVYAGVDRTSGAKVAIKVIQAASATELDELHSFLREARAASHVPHPAVVRMIHVDVSADGLLFQVQELVDGENLHARLADGRPWDAGRAARVVATLCDALATAHAAGVIHRDVKPANMMLTRDPPGLKLLDFGISKVRSITRGGDTSSNGKIAGTPAYMAPECFEGKRVTDRADVFAVGVLLFRMLTARYPFDDVSTRERLAQPAREALDLKEVAPSIPAGMSALVERCLDHEPTARPSARELARALGAIADAEGAPSLERVAVETLSAAPMGATSEEMSTKFEGRGTPRSG